MAKRRSATAKDSSKFSVKTAIFFISLASAIALIFVNKEIKIDQKAREVKALQDNASKLQVSLAETRIEIDRLTSFHRISRQAERLGLLPLTKKPIVINVSWAEIPVEFSREMEQIKSDN
jgi:hypothetical protein